jgi:hypothetical protein
LADRWSADGIVGAETEVDGHLDAGEFVGGEIEGRIETASPRPGQQSQRCRSLSGGDLVRSGVTLPGAQQPSTRLWIAGPARHRPLSGATPCR